MNPARERARMRSRHNLPWLIVFLVAVALLVGGCRPAKPTVATVKKVDTSDQQALPDWMLRPPDDWAEELWIEYRQSLQRLREPIIREKEYSADELTICTAEVEHMVGEYEDNIKKEWDDKWSSRLTSYELTGGCGCCNEVYTVTGPRAAIEEFPMTDGRREYYPKYLQSKP